MSSRLYKEVIILLIIITFLTLEIHCFNDGPYKNRSKLLFKSMSNCKLEENKCLLPGSTDNKAECINVEFPISKNSDGFCEIEDDFCYILSIKKSRKLNIENKTKTSTNDNENTSENSDIEKFKNFYCSCKSKKTNSNIDERNKRCFYEDINSCYDYSEGEITNNLSMKKICGLNKNSNPNCSNVEYENFEKTYEFRLTYFKDMEKEQYYKFSPIGNSIEIPDEKLEVDNIDICHCPEYFMCYESTSRNICSPTVYEKVKPKDKKSNREYDLIMHYPNRDGLYCLNTCKENHCYDNFNTHTCIPINNEIISDSEVYGFCKCIDPNQCIDHELFKCINPTNFMDVPSRVCQCIAIDQCYRHDNYECVPFNQNDYKSEIVKCICPEDKPCINYPAITEFGDINKGTFNKFDSNVKCSKVKKGFKSLGNNRDCIPMIDENTKTDL